MISKLFSPLTQYSRTSASLAALLILTDLGLGGSARASVIDVSPNAVVTGDTFGVEIVAYNVATPNGNFYAITNNLMPTFGTTQTFANSAANGQTVTVTSGETQNGNIFTDTITISVPTTFVPAGTVDSNGNVVNALEFSIGNFNVPLGGTANTLDYNVSLATYFTTGTLGYTIGGTPGSLGLTQTNSLTNGGKSFSSEEAGQTPMGGTISAYNPSSFTLTITYTAVPEPSTWAAVALGVGGLAWLSVVRRRTARA